jgi:hypothetical protein
MTTTHVHPIYTFGNQNALTLLLQFVASQHSFMKSVVASEMQHECRQAVKRVSSPPSFRKEQYLRWEQDNLALVHM